MIARRDRRAEALRHMLSHAALAASVVSLVRVRRRRWRRFDPQHDASAGRDTGCVRRLDRDRRDQVAGDASPRKHRSTGDRATRRGQVYQELWKHEAARRRAIRAASDFAGRDLRRCRARSRCCATTAT